ncbi:MAG: tetratricopeptide repeat protein [Bryobacteraceae bacterium]|nr:tetratricopeptide repeat protein [Bryobacteraceae bacterium]
MLRLIAILLAGSLSAQERPELQSILVLPFANSTAVRGLDWIGESLAETLRDRLVAAGLPHVFERGERLEAYRRLSVRPYVPLTRATALKIGLSVDADLILYGDYEILSPSTSAVTPQSSVRFTARVLDGRLLRSGLEFASTGRLEELAVLQNHLAWQALQALAPALAPSFTDFDRNYPAIRVNAIESYVRGLLAAKAEDKYRFLSEAARLDERYSQARFELGHLQLDRGNFKDAATWLEQVPVSDVHHLEASFLLGIARYRAGEYAASEQAFERVLADLPLSPVLNNVALAQARQGRAKSAETLAKASEGDPTDADYAFNAGYLLWRQGNFKGALPGFEAALSRNPDDAEAAMFLGLCQRADPASLKEAPLENRERLKTRLDETAYRQLKMLVEGGLKPR